MIITWTRFKNKPAKLDISVSKPEEPESNLVDDMTQALANADVERDCRYCNDEL